METIYRKRQIKQFCGLKSFLKILYLSKSTDYQSPYAEIFLFVCFPEKIRWYIEAVLTIV